MSTCAVTFLVLLVMVLMSAVIFVTLILRGLVGEGVAPAQTQDHKDCRFKAAVLTDEAMVQKFNTGKNFSEAWTEAEQKSRAPAHIYMEKHHSTAIYAFTRAMLQPVGAEASGKQQRETLTSSLSEALQVLRHSQATCHSTTYRTDTIRHPNIHRLVRFSTFILGSEWTNSTRAELCFHIRTCFGADVTHYSALTGNSQVLIPPYEVFEVISMETDAQRCKVLYRLKSDLNCVYDRASDTLQPVSASAGGSWFMFSIVCLGLVSVCIPFVIMKVIEDYKKNNVCRVSPMHNSSLLLRKN